MSISQERGTLTIESAKQGEVYLAQFIKYKFKVKSDCSYVNSVTNKS